MQVLDYDTAYKESLEYFGGDELAAKVFLDKYALRDIDGNILESSPEQMLRRVAREIARVEEKKFKKPLTEDDIFAYFDRFKRIIPQGSLLFGVGNDNQITSLSNCFAVDSPTDSYSGILSIDHDIVQISKRRGGAGTDLSNLRPSGTATANAARSSTGVVTFADRYSHSIREVGQGGRRGALMITLSVHHPEVIAFAKSKEDLSKITGANISIRLTDDFMNAVVADEVYEQRWPVDSSSPKISNMVSAKEVWMEIIKRARDNGEPGLMFWDRVISESPADCYADLGFKTVTSNPCSELFLSPYDSCRLLLLNLFGYVVNPFKRSAYFDFDAFASDCQVAQRLMDDFIDLEIEAIDKILNKVKADPEPEEIKLSEIKLWEKIKGVCQKGRRTGTGITALGDVMAALGLKYASTKSIEVVEKIYKTLKLNCYRSSVDMAKEIGAFPVWNADLEKKNPFLLRIKEEDPDLYRDMNKYGRRNIGLLTTSPAGSMSILTQTTSGIEPLFKMSYKRRKKINPSDQDSRVDFEDQNGDKWQEFDIYHPRLKQWMEVTGKTDVNESPYSGCCANDLDWKNRINLLSMATKNIDHSISVTINLPENVTVEQVGEIYEMAWKSGCKGITIYREGSRTGVLVSNKKKEDGIVHSSAAKRPKRLPCDVHHVSVKGESYIVLVGVLNGEPYEVFAGNNGQVPRSVKKGEINKVKRGHYEINFENGSKIESVIDIERDEEEAMTRMISTSLRHGADISFVVHQLEKTKGELTGFSKSVARSLKKYIIDGTKVTGESCPSCNSENLERSGGCPVCKDCGFTRCN